MAAVMYRHTSTASLVSQSSVQFEAGVLVQCLNKYKESLECGCERVLESLYSKSCFEDSNNLNYCALSSGKSSPNLLVSRSPSRTGNNKQNTNLRRLDPRARESLGQHLIELLATLVLPDPPQSIGEVDSRLSNGLPSIPDKLMPTETDAERYRTLAEKGRKKGLHLPVEKIYLALKDFNGRFNQSVCIYIVAVAEHIIGNFLQAAICYEEKALTENIIRASTVETLFILYRDRIQTRRKVFEHRLANRFPQDYDKCVDELDNFLHACLEQMNLLLRVFREPVLSISNLDQTDEENVNLIFGSILDLYNNMRIFLDTVDSEEEDSCVTSGLKSSFTVPTDATQSIAIQDSSPLLFNTSTVSDGNIASSVKSVDDIAEHSPSRLTTFTSIIRSGHVTHTQRRRLVGVCLLELAEDDSLHAFSQYATTVLDSLSRDRAWTLCETGHLITLLCRLSRTILHTTSLNKTPSNPTGNCLSGSLDPRLTDVHSFTCTRCRYWDTIMTTPRRRSTSSNSIRLINSANVCSDANSEFLSSKATIQRSHRASHSSSTCEVPPGAAECNFLVNAFKYLLPRLLLLPIFQFFYLHELIETLHRCAYDEEECGRLIEVLSMLRKTRLSLERDLSKHSWVCLHLARLISTGHLVGRYLPFYLDMLAGSACPPSPIHSNSDSHTTPPSPTTNVGSSLCSQSYLSHPLGITTPVGNNPQQPCVSFGFSTSSVEVPGCGQPGKAEEIERLLGGKEKLLTSNCNRSELGDFVMEGRVHLRTESKRSSTEHIAYLFTGLLVICKWQERRATLNPGVNQLSVLRIKRRIPLDAIHVIDMPPIVQPNLPAYVGNSGTVTSSAVGAAVLAAASAVASNNTAHLDECSHFPNSGLNGSILSHSSLVGSGGSGCANYPYSFELEFVDPVHFTNTTSTVGSTHRSDPFPQTRHTSPQKLYCSSLSPGDSTHGDSTNVSGSSSTVGCTDPNCPAGLSVHHIWFSLRTLEEKADWMASLLSIQLHRLFLRYIRTLPKIEVPLRLPSPSNYRFAQPDTPENIIFETSLPTDTTTQPELRPSMDSSDDGLDDDTCLPAESDDYEPSTSTLDVYNTSGVQMNLDADVESQEGSCRDVTTQNPVSNKLDDANENDMVTLTAANSSDVLKLLVTKPSTPARPSGSSFPRKIPVSSGVQPQIRMATLEKLVERMTYPSYFDARLVNTFLLVYRRVTTPDIFLDLLIERFRIPDPDFLPVELEVDTEQGQLESPAQHMLKRFRSGYKKRVQARVIMVLSRWVRSNRYYQNDFAPRPDLCQRLVDFLSTIQARHLLSAVRRIVQHLQTAPIDVDTGAQQTCTDSNVTCPANSSVRRSESPSKESHSSSPEQVNKSPLLNLNLIHPYKLAEQVTLYEWELYRRIQFWEVDCRDRSGHPTLNLDKSKSFSNRFRNWLVYAILSEPHPDDRVVAIQRVIDLMLIMEHMNNLQGSQEAKSALISAAVFRLRKAFQSVRKLRHYRQVVDRIRREATTGPKTHHNNTGSQENNVANPTSSPNLFGPGLPFSTKASRAHERRIKDLEKRQASGEATNPCVPFIAAGVMTRLIHLDVLHSDTITTDAGTVLINCWKHRQLAEVVERYLAFQRIPYEFSADLDTRAMLEQLDPLTLVGVSSEAEFERRMYELSEIYEPRESEAVVDTSPNSPAAEPERHMSKEEIQAANLLSSVSLKERMSPQSVFNFSAALSSQFSGSVFSSSASRIFTPPNAVGFRSPRKTLKNPQSASPPLHGKSSHSQDRDLSGKQQKHRYLRIPPTSPPSGSIGTQNDTLPPAPGAHQHSMSDSHVFKMKKRTTSHHQTMHSIGTPGVSGTVTTTEMELRCLTGPSPPFSSSYASSNLIDSPASRTPEPLPPPLPPRKSGQATSGSSIANARKSHSPLPFVITPPPPLPSPPGLSPHHYNQNNESNNFSWIPSDVVDNPIYFPQVSPTPPPLPPKFGGSRTSIRASSSSASSSPHHQTNHQSQPPSNGQAFCFGPDMGPFIRDIPPPLPPRKLAVTTPPATSVDSQHGSVSNELSSSAQLRVTR